MTVKDFVEIAHGVGVSGILLVLAYLWVPKIGNQFVSGCSWFGQEFFIPIRDSIVGNVNILTSFIMEMRAAVPQLMAGHTQVSEDVNEMKDRVDSLTADGEKTRATIRATVQVMSSRCPEDSQTCPFKQKNVMDSDEVAKWQQAQKDKEKK